MKKVNFSKTKIEYNFEIVDRHPFLRVVEASRGEAIFVQRPLQSAFPPPRRIAFYLDNPGMVQEYRKLGNRV